MTQRLDTTVATVTADNLFYANTPVATTDGVVIASGEGELKRGCVLAKNASGKFVALGTKQEKGYIKADATTPGALKVVESSAGTGEIAVASVTPVIDSKYTPVANDYVIYQKDTVLEADCILCDDVDATKADVNAVVYRTGHFDIGSLTTKKGYTFADVDKDILRTKGVLVSKALK